MAIPRRFARIRVPGRGTNFLASSSAICDDVMKLMGRHLLHRLATSGTGDLAGAVSALCAELEAARWASPTAALADYPQASLDKHRLEIPISDGVSVRLAINSAAGAVLIEGVG